MPHKSGYRGSYRRPPDVKAEIRKAGRAVERGIKQAKSDISYGVRAAGPAVETVRQSVEGGINKIKRSIKSKRG